MNLEIRPMRDEDWPTIAEIYQQGIETGKATFDTDVPSYYQWNAEHIAECRITAVYDGEIAGFAALSTISTQYVFRGVADISIYISPVYRHKGFGKALLTRLIEESEKRGYWTLQSDVMDDNLPGLKLHNSCGFRKVGTRNKIGRDINGKWRSTVLMERRSTIVGID